MGKKRQKLNEREINKEISIPVIPPSRKRVNGLRSDAKKIVIDNKIITLNAFLKRPYVYADGVNAGKEVSREDKKLNLTIVDGKPLIYDQPIILLSKKDSKIIRYHEKIVVENKTITFDAFLKRPYVYADGVNAGKEVSLEDKRLHLTMKDGKPYANGQAIIVSKYNNFHNNHIKNMGIAVRPQSYDLPQSDTDDAMNVHWDALIHDLEDIDWNVLSVQPDTMNAYTDALIHDPTDTDLDAVFAQYNADSISPSPTSMAKASKFGFFNQLNDQAKTLKQPTHDISFTLLK